MSGTSIGFLRTWCAGAAIVLALTAPPAAGADLRERLLDDARDGQLDEFGFLTAALITGGVGDECELEGWLDRYGQCREQLLQSLPTSEPQGQWKAIHDALHKQLL